MNLIKYFIAAFPFLILFFFSISLTSQELIRFDRENLSAKVHPQRWLRASKLGHQERLKSEGKPYKKDKKFPVIGTYSPTGYSMPYVRTGVGLCDYIYIETKNQLEPGKQYHLSLIVKLPEEYDQMPYYQKHFGIALSSDLFENEFGLWPKHFIPFNIKVSEELVNVDIEFRPLCVSKYIIIGVFQGDTMGGTAGFLRRFDFELHSLTVEPSKNNDSMFYYICDGFVEEKLKKWKTNFTTDTIFFDSGSALIKEKYKPLLDTIPKKLRTVQDLVSLYAYTDKKGSENEQLGAARNASVRQALIQRGLDSSRIVMVNYGESKASDIISQQDRRVEIDVNLGKLFQKYYTEALKSAGEDDFGAANKAIKNWLQMVPAEKAIYALFDCWGDGTKATMFRRDLRRKIKSKFYRYKSLKFTLDSLYCESIKGDGLSANLTYNHLPMYQNNCDYKTDRSRTKKLQNKAEQIYLKHGFPTVETVGRLANNTLPGIILLNDNLDYLQNYLPIVREACEKEQIRWGYFAHLYDKIAVKRTGFQRYGTRITLNDEGTMVFFNPIEDIDNLNEYRKQVKLIPYPQKVIEETEDNQQKIDKTLVSTLNTIYQSDQKYRRQTDEIEDEFGVDSDTLVAHWKLINKADSLNLIKVKDILDNRGWLSPQIIGNQGSNTLFLVIQHSDLETQLKYLPMMRKAVKLGNAKASELALLEDRVAIRQGKKQIYGSQIGRDSTGVYYVEPIAEPEKVNERRAKIGLGTIEKYLSNWGIEWRMENIGKSGDGRQKTEAN